MPTMRPSFRLWWCLVIIALSLSYGVLVTQDRQFASAIALGYIALVMTIFLVINVWKKP